MHYDHSHKTAVPTELLQDPYLSVDTKGLAAILCSFGQEAFELSELADQLRDNLSDERTFRALMELYDIYFLTRDEQRRFLDAARGTKNYHQYAFMLETGLRTGEMIGLTWDAVALEKRTLTVNKTLEYRYDLHTWRAGPPKTPDSYRTIPLTHRAVEILEECRAEREGKKLSPALSQKLLGHASIQTTMDRYVHVTTESLDEALRQFEANRVAESEPFEKMV